MTRANSGIIWQYWDGRRRPWVSLFNEIARLHNPNVVMLDDASWKALWLDDHIDLSALPIAKRTDFIRLYLLYTYGGIWLDADCIVMRNFTELFAHLDTHDLMVYDERDSMGADQAIPMDVETCDNNFIGAPSMSHLIEEWLLTVIDLIKSGAADASDDWTILGKTQLTPLVHRNRNDIKILDGSLIQPIHWIHGASDGPWFKKRTDAEHAEIHVGNAYTYMLTRGIMYATRGWSRERWMTGREYLCFLVRKALAGE